MASGTGPSPERRKYPRVPVTKASSVRIYRAVERFRGTTKAYGFLRDLSAGGMGIDTVLGPLAEEMKPGELYVIRLPMKFFEEELFCRCRLKYKRTTWLSVCGFEFEDPMADPEYIEEAE